MDISKAFADPKLEKAGVWLEYRDGSQVKVARAGNQVFSRAHAARMKPHLRKQRDGNMDAEVETRILCEAIAEGILVDWKGFEEDGKELKYTKARASALLISSMDFRNEVVELAATEAYFHADFEEASIKN